MRPTLMLWKSYVVKNAYHTISVNLNSFRGLTDFAVTEKGNAMRLIDANALIKEANVTHWMPLPEPPKGE